MSLLRALTTAVRTCSYSLDGRRKKFDFRRAMEGVSRKFRAIRRMLRLSRRSCVAKYTGLEKKEEGRM